MSIPGKFWMTKRLLLGMAFLACGLFVALGGTNEVE